MFLFNLKKHYKIWFSKNPNEFLDIENQLRFIRVVEKNRDSVFTLIYSSNCLSASGLDQLNQFCETYHITSLDFDAELPALLDTANDKTLYNLAAIEIEKTLLGIGGNMAAASDIVRQLVAVNERCGMYNDFEIQFDFSSCDEFFQLETPVVLNLSCEDYKAEIPRLCNDTIALSLDDNDHTKLSHKAFSMIEQMQEQTIKNYQNPQKAIIGGWHNDAPKGSDVCAFSKMITIKYFTNQIDASVFDFRTFAESLDFEVLFLLLYGSPISSQKDDIRTIKNKFVFGLLRNNGAELIKALGVKSGNDDLIDKFIQFIKHRLLTFSVMSITGPQVVYSLFADITPKSLGSDKSTLALSKMIADCSRSLYFSDNFRMINYTGCGNVFDMVGGNPLFNQSWTDLGSEKKKVRESALKKGVMGLEILFLKYKDSKNGTENSNRNDDFYNRIKSPVYKS